MPEEVMWCFLILELELSVAKNNCFSVLYLHVGVGFCMYVENVHVVLFQLNLTRSGNEPKINEQK